MDIDPGWEQIVDAAERLHDLAASQDLRGTDRLGVTPNRVRSFLTVSVTEGLELVNYDVQVFEPVRRRRFLRHDWRPVQPLAVAVRSIEEFIERRPDLQPDDLA
jgi:hypothetical protein